MGWLLKQPQIGQTVQLYTIGQTKTVLLVGLGNIGQKYTGTRHNIGFACIDAFVSKHTEMSTWTLQKDLKAHVSKGRLGDTQVVAMKPTTFMNLSGEAVRAVCQYYKIALSSIVVVHDELDIVFGQIRMRLGGSDAGHNGIKSLSSAVGEAYERIRIGIGPKTLAEIDSADFVLQRFTAPEQAQLPNLMKEVTAILTEFIYGGQLLHETRTFITKV